MCILLVRKWLLVENDLLKKRIRIAFERHNIIDCENVNIPCIVDDQCRDNCKGGLTMRCNEGGFCSKGINFLQPRTCDADKGLVMVFNAVGDLVVEKVCISLYRDIIDDNGNLRSYVCENGEIAINLQEGPFSVTDCECGNGFTRFSYTSGAFSRAIPVCLPNYVAQLYKRIYSLT